MEDIVVAIVGAGPAGLAVSACLKHLSVPNVVFEKEECFAPLWKKRAYDRLKLHLGKEFCSLPHRPFPVGLQRFMPKNKFIDYLDDYVSHFKIEPHYNRSIDSASYDERIGKWCIQVRNTILGETETYFARFLVVATGENSEGVIPDVPGLDGFEGEWMHSHKYMNGGKFTGKDVLVVGGGNSGMEIAFDLSNSDANTSIVIRNPIHMLTKEMVFLGMTLLKFLPCAFVDTLILLLSKLRYRNMYKNYGIQRPKEGPFLIKQLTGRSATIDVGAMDKIKQGKIKVVPTTIESIEGQNVTFEDGKVRRFDAIIFATGYKSTVCNWLKGHRDLFNQKGMPKLDFPNHWKGKNGLYCAGFGQRGLAGISRDAITIANDIALYMLSD